MAKLTNVFLSIVNILLAHITAQCDWFLLNYAPIRTTVLMKTNKGCTYVHYRTLFLIDVDCTRSQDELK